MIWALVLTLYLGDTAMVTTRKNYPTKEACEKDLAQLQLAENTDARCVMSNGEA